MKNIKIIFLNLLIVFLSSCTDRGEIIFTPAGMSSTSDNIAVGTTDYNVHNNATVGQLLRIKVNRSALYEKPTTYRAIVRLDPRFAAPYVYAVKLNKASNYYTPTWHANSLNAVNNFSGNLTSLISFTNNSPLKVHAGDAVSIKIIDRRQFYDSSMQNITSDLTGANLVNYNFLDLSSIITDSGGVDNALINTVDIAGFCSYSSGSCLSPAANGTRKLSSQNIYSKILTGLTNITGAANITKCDLTIAGSQPFCIYDAGLGLEFRLNSDLMKRWKEPFVNVISSGGTKKAYYFIAPEEGNINFTFPTELSTSGIFSTTVTTTAPSPLVCGKIVTIPLGSPANLNSNDLQQALVYFWNNGVGNLCLRWPFTGYDYMGIGVGNANTLCSNKIQRIPNQTLPSATAFVDVGYGPVQLELGDLHYVNGALQSDPICYPSGLPIVNVSEVPWPNQYASHWGSSVYVSNGVIDPRLVMNSISSSNLNKFAAGRYFFEIDTGSSTGDVLQEKIQNIKVKYTIKDSSGNSSSGYIDNDLFETNSPLTGSVFISIENSYEEIYGNMLVKTETYTGSAAISKFLNDDLIKPLKEQLLKLSAGVFSALVTNAKFILFAHSCLTLYILFYALAFSIGSVKVTIDDLVARVIKVLIVAALFTNTSWSFFNDYLFVNFLETSDKVINALTNETSSSGNIFGFIDPMLAKYFDKNLWSILGTYFLFIGYGYIVPAIFIIMGILYFLRAVVHIFIGCVMSYLSLCVMIAMGPLFIVALLFEKTKDYFNNWIGVMFGYVLQPILIMVFMLFIDQISTEMLTHGLTSIAYGCLYDIGLYIDHPDINQHFFCINGYKPTNLDTTSVPGLYRVGALFFCVMKLADNVVKLADTIASTLTQGGVAGGGVADDPATSYEKGMAGTMIDHGHMAAKFIGSRSAHYAWKGTKATGRAIANKFSRKKSGATDDLGGESIIDPNSGQGPTTSSSQPSEQTRSLGSFENIETTPKSIGTTSTMKWAANPLSSHKGAPGETVPVEPAVTHAAIDSAASARTSARSTGRGAAGSDQLGRARGGVAKGLSAKKQGSIARAKAANKSFKGPDSS